MPESLLNRTSASARRSRAWLSFGLAGAALCALGGCAALPSSGPDVNQVVKASQGPAPAFRIVDLSPVAEKALASAPSARLSDLDALGSGAAQPVDLIQVGDTLQITVFEVGSSLFAGASAASQGAAAMAAAPAANAASLPVAPVSPDGGVTLPYIGRLEAAGRTPGELAAEIEAGLRGKSQSPQVMVTVRDDVGNTVMLMGDVKTPGRKPLSYRRESLLDMIAIAGGADTAKPDVIVRVTRDGRSVEMRLGDIESGSPDDITLRPQDRIELINRPRTFTAFGAAGKVSEIQFQTNRLSLAEALARMGGPLDQQADSSGVFIFRAHQPTDAVPVVYRLNLKDPSGFFVAQRFEVEDKDLILVANAQSDAWYKFLAIVNSIVSPIVTAKYLGAS